MSQSRQLDIGDSGELCVDAAEIARDRHFTATANLYAPVVVPTLRTATQA